MHIPPSTIAQRLFAGAVHLCISLLVVSTAMALIFLIWYPAPLSEAEGVSRVVLILIAVDVTIGPLITVLIFNRAKKKLLQMDLVIVGCLQVGALLYGLHSIFIARPAVLVFNVDRFDAVAAMDINRSSLEKARKTGGVELSWIKPQVVFAKPPTSPKERQALFFSAAAGGPDLAQMPEYYKPYPTGRKEVLSRARSLEQLRPLNPMSDEAWAEMIRGIGRPESSIGYIPLSAKVKDGAVIIDMNTAEILKITLLEPKWD